MEQHSILIYILLAIVITNLIRVTPMVLIKGELHNRFVRSFLYYVPYVTPLCAQLPVLCALRHAGRDDLPRYDYGYANSIARNNCAVGWHRCSMVPSGTFPSRSHLLCHRLFIDIKADREIWIACTWQRLAKRMNNQCLSEPPDCRGEPSIH